MKILLPILVFFFTGNAYSNEHLPELIIKEIQKGIYLHKSFFQTESFGLVSSNGLIVIENKNAFLIDTPWSERDTKTLAAWVADNGYELIGSISTHSHDDRTAGIRWLNANSIKTYATTLTNKILKEAGKERVSNAFDGPDFSLNGGTIEAFYPGGGHTIDNIVIWLPNSKLLFGGCFIRSLGSKNLGYTGEAHINEWADSVDKVLSKYPDAEIVVPGHGKIGDAELLKHTNKLAVSAQKKLKK